MNCAVLESPLGIGHSPRDEQEGCLEALSMAGKLPADGEWWKAQTHDRALSGPRACDLPDWQVKHGSGGGKSRCRGCATVPLARAGELWKEGDMLELKQRDLRVACLGASPVHVLYCTYCSSKGPGLFEPTCTCSTTAGT